MKNPSEKNKTVSARNQLKEIFLTEENDQRKIDALGKNDMKPPGKKIPIGFVLLGLFLALSVAPSVYFYLQYKQTVDKIAGSGKEATSLVAKVAGHMLLPTGETPTIMTVTDREKLSGQLFFAHAKNGDKVLIFEKAKKAFLYDPDRDIVLEVGPVTFGTPSGAIATQPQVTPTPSPLRFVLLNGTTSVGLTRTFEAKLTQAVPGAVVLDRDNAARLSYENSLLVDLTGKNASSASQLAASLGIALGQLPQGEATVSADYLIILGEDQR